MRITVTASLLLASLFFVSTGCGDLESLAQGYLYPISSVNKATVPDQPPAGYQQDILETRDSDGEILKVHFWSMRQQDAKSPVIFYFHGNGENLGTLQKSNFLKLLEALGCHLVLMDYAGYGKSTGVPSQMTILPGTEVVFDWIQNRFPDSPIFVWGWSLGAAVAAQVTVHHQDDLNGFILTSAWSDLRSLAKELFGKQADDLPETWYQKNSWDSVAAAKSTRLPGLMFHGTKDNVIPFSFGQRLAQAQDASLVRFISIEGKKHNDIFQSTDVWAHVKDFIAKNK
jgi:hypothetical protein